MRKPMRPLQLSHIMLQFLASRGLSEEGLFRVSGEQARVTAAREKVDAGEDLKMGRGDDPHIFSGLLKLYLRMLPAPLLGAGVFQEWLHVGDTSQGRQAQIERARTLVRNALSPMQLGLLVELMWLLHLVASHASKTKMPPSNLGLLLGPSMLSPQVPPLPVTKMARYSLESQCRCQ
jgi:hypothetical protein